MRAYAAGLKKLACRCCEVTPGPRPRAAAGQLLRAFSAPSPPSAPTGAKVRSKSRRTTDRHRRCGRSIGQTAAPAAEESIIAPPPVPPVRTQRLAWSDATGLSTSTAYAHLRAGLGPGT
eukprot:353273-Chlamydomonas_euryale.AAC.6